MTPVPPPEKYRLICTREIGSPAHGEYRYTAESHATLDGLLLALADHRQRDWDAILIRTTPRPEVPHDQ
jgi:hypothetical protein